MITTERTITICGDKSKIDEPILLYRGDFEVEVKFKIFNSKYKFQNGLNLIAVENAAYGQLAILAPNGDNVFSNITKCVEGAVSFVITGAMIDELKEVGKYSFQIRLFDANKTSRVTTPPVEFGLIVGEPVASEDTTEKIDEALVGYSIARATSIEEPNVGPAFDGMIYNKTDWESGDRITADKMNKIENAIDTLNKNNIENGRITSSNFNVLDSKKMDKNEVFSMANMGQDIREAMTGGSVSVVGRDAVLNENIVDGQITYDKTDFLDTTQQVHTFENLTSVNDIYTTGSIGDMRYNITTPADGRHTFIFELDPYTEATIEVYNCNRCRIGVWYYGAEASNKYHLVGENPYNALIYDDTVTSWKGVTSCFVKSVVVIYVGQELEIAPNVKITTKMRGNEYIVANDKLYVANLDTSFITLDRIMIGTDGHVYRKTAIDTDYDMFTSFAIDARTMMNDLDIYLKNDNDDIRIAKYKHTLEDVVNHFYTNTRMTLESDVIFTSSLFNKITVNDITNYNTIVIYFGKGLQDLNELVYTHKLNNDVYIDKNNVLGLSNNIETCTDMELLNSNNIIVRETQTGTVFAYESPSNDKKEVFNARLAVGDYKLDIENANRCRIVLYDKNYNEIYFITKFSEEDADRPYKILRYDEDEPSVGTFSLAFKVDRDSTIIGYIGLGEKEPGKATIRKYIDLATEFQNIPTISKIEKMIGDSLSDFRPSSIVIQNTPLEDDNIEDIDPIYEFPAASNEWATVKNNKQLDMTSTEFLNRFYDRFVGYHYEDGLRVVKNFLGKDHTGQYDIYEYDFIPVKPAKTILLTSGLHTYELSASFGLAHFVEEYMKYPYCSDGFEYLRQHVRIKIIPILNPWGWNQKPYKKYGNVNGVNINRNFTALDSNGNNIWDSFPVHSSDPSDPTYNEWNIKGEAPFSETETRLICDWVLNNSNTEYWIDCHTGLGYNQYDNWIVTVDQTFGNTKYNNALYAVEQLSRRIKAKYGQNSRNYIQVNEQNSIKHKWSGLIAKVPCITIEQAPENRLWGTYTNNESGDITEYAVCVYAYVLSMLRPNM